MQGPRLPLADKQLSSPPRTSDLGLWSLQERNSPCSREGEVGLESCDGLLALGVRDWGKQDIQDACLFWLALIRVSASNISISLHWLKFKGARLNSREECAGIFVDTHMHAKAHICIISPKMGEDLTAYKYMQKHKMEN